MSGNHYPEGEQSDTPTTPPTATDEAAFASQPPAYLQPTYQPPFYPPPPRKRGPRLGLLLSLAVVSLLLAGLAYLLLQPKGGSVTLGLATADARSILAAADAAQDKLTSLRYVMRASFDKLPGSTGPTNLDLRGEIVRPDRYTLAGAAVGDYIVIASDTYFKQVGGSSWVKTDQPQPGSVLINPNKPLGDYASYYKDAVVLADEQVAGVACYHLKLNLSGSDLGGLAGSGSIAVEAWIGKADSLERKVLLDLSLPGSAQAIRTRVETTFSDFNAAIKIDPPPTVNPQ